MSEHELTDEEIQGIVTGGYAQYVHLGQPECRKAIDRAIARAAVQKFYQWLMESCHEHGQDPHLMMARIDCPACMEPFEAALEGK